MSRSTDTFVAIYITGWINQIANFFFLFTLLVPFRRDARWVVPVVSTVELRNYRPMQLYVAVGSPSTCFLLLAFARFNVNIDTYYALEITRCPCLRTDHRRVRFAKPSNCVQSIRPCFHGIMSIAPAAAFHLFPRFI